MLATICPCGHVGCCIFDKDFYKNEGMLKAYARKCHGRMIDVLLT